VTFTYDGMNRVKTKLLSTGGLWNYAYDTGTNGKGKLVSVVKQGSTDGCYYDGYDAIGRLTASHQVTDAVSYTSGYGYDLAGNNTSQVYPSGKEYRTVFDNAGRTSSVSRYISNAFDKTYASQFQYTPHGGVSSMSLGNNTAETMQYNSRFQPTMIELRKTDNSLVLGLDYTYGATSANNGNVATQAIRIGNGGTTTTINQSYGYDNLNRLHTASETGSWSQTYEFDQYGNRWVSQSPGYPIDASLCPTQQGQIGAATNRILMTGFSYDFSGNQKTQIRNGQNENYDYDSENHLVSINSGGTGSYVYDGDGRRVKKTDSAGTTVFVYNAGGQLIAKYHSDPVPPAAGGGGTSYLTSDHLGSTRVVTRTDGSVKARYDYLPFGEELGATIGSRTVGMGYSAADSTRQKFTQKERDSESGLDYFGERYYSSAQGRFTTVDPLGAIKQRMEGSGLRCLTFENRQV
jgi:RHS repeat-associated protein